MDLNFNQLLLVLVTTSNGLSSLFQQLDDFFSVEHEANVVYLDVFFGFKDFRLLVYDFLEIFDYLEFEIVELPWKALDSSSTFKLIVCPVFKL